MKKKLLTFVYILILITIIFIFQMFIINNRTLFGVKPNLILISTIIVSLWYGLYAGTFYSFVIGLITDLLFGNTFGLFTVSYTMIGAVIGYLNTTYRKENKVSLIYLTILATFLFEIISYIIYAVTFHVFANIFYLLIQAFLGSLLNIVIVYIVYSLIYKIAESLDHRLKQDGNVF
ncbi:MAG: rod shape-determining protein MreD [Clostridia bacterium]|nr:rod shape-determining protein MreD [Clostridia bacterium]